MNMTVRKAEAVQALPIKQAAEVVRLKARKTSFADSRLVAGLSAVAARVVPPLVMLALLLIVWQLLCSKPGATLPSPTKIWSEARDLIVDPFFVAGPQDIGLGWRVLTSLQRVMIGYGLAGVIGIALGTLIGQSVWAMRGLDPIFQVLRTISPLAWLPISLAAFRDSQPSAIFVIFITSVWPIIINTAVGIRNIPEDYRNVARVLRLNQFEFFMRIMIPSAAPYIFTGLADRHRPVVAGHRGGRDADRRRRHRLLHLGRVEFLAPVRHRGGARLHRPGRLRARPRRGVRRQHRHPRHGYHLRARTWLI